jgi:AcrR family transcriptional regulator
MSAAKVLRWERRPDERIPELLEAALEVFAKNGYRNTRLDDVAVEAGVTKGTIYHYFDTKEALLLGVVEHYQALALGRVEDVLRDVGLTASERIRQLMRKTFLGRPKSGRHLLALLIRDIAHEVPRVHERWLRDGPVRLWTLIGRVVDEGQERGEFRSDADGIVASRNLVSAVLLQLMWQQHASAVPGLAVDDDRLIDSAVELFLAGLRRPPSKRKAQVRTAAATRRKS